MRKESDVEGSAEKGNMIWCSVHHVNWPAMNQELQQAFSMASDALEKNFQPCAHVF
jgi:hypothetical protein